MDWHSVKVGILKLEVPHKRSERTKKYLQGNKFKGLKIIIREIQKHYKINPEFCDINSIDKYNIVLISLISYSDIYNLIYTFEKNQVHKWKCKIVIGGSAVVNIQTYEKYGDYFCFGRGEISIHEIFMNIFLNQPVNNQFVYIRGQSSFNNDHFLRVSEKLYIDKHYKIIERSHGCYKNCYYCQYTNISKSPVKLHRASKFFQYGHETNFENIKIDSVKRYTTALDGMTQHLRYAFNKRISDNSIKTLFLSTPSIPGTIYLKLYNICGYPTEQTESLSEMLTIFHNIACLLKQNNFIVQIFFTPFTPEPCTPSEFLEANIFFNFRSFFKNLKKDSQRYLIDTKHLKLYIPDFTFTGYTLLKRMLINRGTWQDNHILQYLLFDKQQANHDLLHDKKLELAINKFDCSKFYRRLPLSYRSGFSHIWGHKPKNKLHAEKTSLAYNLFAPR